MKQPTKDKNILSQSSVESYPKVILWIIGLAAIVQIIQNLTLPILGDDAWFHLNWLDQFHQLQSKGVGYPRWLNSSNGGFGSPTFYFYPPLPYFLGSAILTLFSGLSLSALYHLLGFIATALSAYACYYYLRKLNVDQLPSLAGALFYSIAPYRFVDLYARCALGEHFSFIFLPLLLASIEVAKGGQFTERKILRSIVLSALGWAGVILSNVPALVMFSLVFLFYAIIRLWGELKHSYPALLGAMLGALICGDYILPISEMRKYVQMHHIFDIGSQTQRWSFTLLEIFQSEWSASHILNLITIVATVGALYTLIRKWYLARDEKTHGKTLFATWIVILAIALFFQIPAVSVPFWNLPIINLIKYSWRWNVILTLGLAVFVSMLTKGKTLWLTYGLISLLLLSTILTGVKFARDFAVHNPPEVIKEYYMDAPEYYPIYANSNHNEVMRFARAHRDDPSALLANELGTITVVKEESERIIYSADIIAPVRVTFHQFHWPEWRLWQDRTEIPLTFDENGRAVAQLNKGKYPLELRLERTPAQTIGVWITSAGLLLLLMCFGYLVFLPRKKVSNTPATIHTTVEV